MLHGDAREQLSAWTAERQYELLMELRSSGIAERKADEIRGKLDMIDEIKGLWREPDAPGAVTPNI